MNLRYGSLLIGNGVRARIVLSLAPLVKVAYSPKVVFGNMLALYYMQAVLILMVFGSGKSELCTM